MAEFIKLDSPTLQGSWARAGPADCTTKRRSTTLGQGAHDKTIVYTHSDCVCNEMLALLNRHQKGGMTPPPPAVVQRLKDTMRTRLLRAAPLEKRSYSEVMGHYAGPKRKALLIARAELIGDPVKREDSWVKMFLKEDKYTIDGGSDLGHKIGGPSTTYNDMKAPRCIQYRTKRYQLELARFLQPVEKMVYGWEDAYGVPIIAKSRNSHQRAQDLLAKSLEFEDPVFFLLDHSKFDAHCSPELLSVEHWFYDQVYDDRLLRRLMEWQLTNKGITKNHTKYFTPGTRMSGDLNTGLGNCIINAAMLQDWLNQAGVPGTFYVDGDDSVVIVGRRHAEQLRMCGGGVKEHWLSYGMETKCEVVYEWEDVDFCQCKPVFDGQSWRMLRDPSRLMSRTMWTCKKLPPRIIPRYVKSLGMCELAVGYGMPIAQALAQALIKAGSGKYWSKTDHHMRVRGEYYSPTRSRAREVTAAARESYHRAWGITPEQQVEIEAGITFELGGVSQEDRSLYADWFACSC